MTTPRRQPLVALAGPIGALLVLGTAGVVVRDAIVALGWSAGSPWLPDALQRLDGLAPSAALGAVGLGLALIGSALVAIALSPGRRRHLALRTTSGQPVWVHRDTVAELVRDVADRSAGVVETRSRWRGRTLVLSVQRRRDVPGTRADLESAVAPVLTAVPQARLRLRSSEVTP